MVYCRTVGIATLSAIIMKSELIAAARYFNATDSSCFFIIKKDTYFGFTRWVKVAVLSPIFFALLSKMESENSLSISPNTIQTRMIQS